MTTPSFDERVAAIMAACFPDMPLEKRLPFVRDYAKAKGLNGGSAAKALVLDVGKDLRDAVRQYRKVVIVTKAAADAELAINAELGPVEG